MASTFQHFPTAVLRFAVVSACCWGILCSWRLSRADYLYRQDTEQSIRQAISTTPDAWKYYMRLAELEPAHAQELLTTSVHLNPYNSQADVELGLQYEAQEKYARAERWFLRAFAVDRTYMPRWSLASFYFRRGDTAAFWTWAHRAAEMPSDSVEPLFDLCWRISPDANEITRRVLNKNPKLLRQYLDFLLSKNQRSPAADIAIMVIERGDLNSDLSRMFSAINQLIEDDDGYQAKKIWTALSERHWVVADSGFPNNPDFAREPLPVRFDWGFPSTSGVQPVVGPSGLETEFSGLEPEKCTIAEQAMVLGPGNYEMEYTYRTEGIGPNTGLRWQVAAVGAGNTLAESSDLSSETLTGAKMTFSIPQGASLAELRLTYHRALGTVPISGSVVISSVRIQPTL
jgi:tetratricopeptide (TPR) repeat protein